MTPKTRTKIRSAAKVDVYQLVTDRICDALEAGFVPWQRPWKTVGPTGGPRSLSSLKPYWGINVWVLEATSFAFGYSSKWWGTYKQITERGGQVKAGEKGTPVVFWKFIEKTDPATGEVTGHVPFLKHFYVFNSDQADGVRLPAEEETELADHDEIAACEEMAARYMALDGPSLDFGGDRACYSPRRDAVQMPHLGQFDTPESYYGTLFHEFVHSTGHESRLNRPELAEMGGFGDENYSREELTAEMGAAFVCGAAGIDVRVVEHASYIQSWLGRLRADTKLLVQAAGAAQKAADLIVGRPDESKADGEEG